MRLFSTNTTTATMIQPVPSADLIAGRTGDVDALMLLWPVYALILLVVVVFGIVRYVRSARGY